MSKGYFRWGAIFRTVGIPIFFMTSRVCIFRRGSPGRFLLSFFKEMKNKERSKKLVIVAMYPEVLKGDFFGLLFPPLWDFTCNFVLKGVF